MLALCNKKLVLRSFFSDAMTGTIIFLWFLMQVADDIVDRSVASSEHTIVLEGGAEVSHTHSALTRKSTKASARSAVIEDSPQTPAELLDLRAAYNDLIIAPQVTHEDIVSVHGKVPNKLRKYLMT